MFIRSLLLRKSKQTTFLLCLLLAHAYGAKSVKFVDGICGVLVDVDLSARITAKDHSGKAVDERIVTSQQLGITERHSICEEEKKSFELTGKGLVFNFTFTRQSSEPHTVSLLQEVRVHPFKTFSGVETKKGHVCFQGRSKTIGSPQFSYLCAKSERSGYQHQICGPEINPLVDSQYSYSLELTMNKIQAQAFNVKGSTFSSSVLCKEPGKRPIGGIIAGCVVGGLLLAVAVVVVVMLIRRKMLSSPSQSNA